MTNTLILIFLVLFQLCYCQNYNSGCVNALANSLSDGSISAIFTNTGKYINDLGDIDGCSSYPEMHYSLITVRVKGQRANLGICVPKKCTQSDMEILNSALESLLKDQSITVTSEFPAEEKVEYSSGNIIGFIFFFCLASLCAFGVVVEYTNLFKDSFGSDTMARKIFLCFSFSRNVYKIFHTTPHKENDYLSILNGVRVLSILYVILGHGYVSISSAPIVDINQVNLLVKPWIFGIVPGGFFAVDTFFFLSAFLGTYLMLIKFYQKQKLNFGMIYFHRVYRIIIPLGLVIAAYLTFYIYLGSGPIWNQRAKSGIEGCKDQWWYALLFVSNMLPWENANHCLGWIWYLANDMQFFLLLPFQILAYKKNRLVGYLLTLLLLIGGMISVVCISAKYKLSISQVADPNYSKYLYYLPWARISPYQVGVLFGMLYYEWMNKDKYIKFTNSSGTLFFQTVHDFMPLRYALYFVGFILINVNIFIQHSEGRGINTERQLSQGFSNFYNMVSRPLFVVSLAMILTGPLTGKGRLLRAFLGNRGFDPWARISFMTYLIHLLIIRMFYFQVKQAVYVDGKQILYRTIAFMFVSFLFSIPFSATFEAPFIQLEKVLLLGKSQRSHKVMKEQEGLLNKSNNDYEIDANLNTTSTESKTE